jgi:predicted NUDIX family phosphoesterase
MMRRQKRNQEHILVVPTSKLWQAGYFQGLCFDYLKYLTVIEDVKNSAFKIREEMENNSNYKQIIPYILLYHNGMVFSYQRGKLLGEKRLLGNYSIGVGGHISVHDINLFETTYLEGMRRELNEEVKISSPYKEYTVALINDDSNEVGSVHLGIVHILCLKDAMVKPREKSINDPGFLDQANLSKNIDKYENWSQICIRNFERIFVPCKRS